jgi:hypothetical protein
MKAARRALVAERCPGSPDSFTCYRRRTLRTHLRSLLLVLGGLFLLNGPQVATNAAAATVAMTFHVAQGGATQPPEPWWSQWGPTDSDNACAATVAIDGYIHTMTGLAADGTISGGTTFASGRPPSALTASIDALQHPPMGGSHQATFWETTIARATTDEVIAYIWEVDTFRVGDAQSTPVYATRSTTGYHLVRDGDSLRAADSWVLEKTTSEISAGSQSLAADIFQRTILRSGLRDGSHVTLPC